MIENPYSELVSMFREEGAKYNSPDLMLGKVLTEEPNITIETGGIQLDKDNLYIADYLLKNHNREISFNGKANLSGGSTNGKTSSASISEHGSHSHSISSVSVSNASHTESGSMTYTSTGLKSGDLVALQQINGTNKFVVYCKLISL